MNLSSRNRLRPPGWAVLLPWALLLAACGAAGQTGPTSFPGVGTDGTTAYVASGAQVFAVDVETGRRTWTYPAEPSRDVSFYAAPAIADDGMIYVGAYDGSVHAVEAATGSSGPEFPKVDGRVIGPPVVAGDVLLIPTDGGSLYAFDRHSGEPKWPSPFTAETDDCGRTGKTPTCSIWSAPLVDGETVYVATLTHVLYAVELATGEEIWRAPLGAAIADTPALQDGLLLTGVLGNSLVIVRAEDGETVWTQPTSGWLWGSPAVADGIAYFGDATPTVWSTKGGEGNVYAFRLAERSVEWSKASPAIATSPLIVDDQVIFALENGQLVAYDRINGGVLWEATASGPIYADPVLAGGKVIVALASGETLLQAFDIANGNPAWSFLRPENG